MPFEPQSHDWPADRALLLVHGVGDYRPGDYDRLKSALEQALGEEEWAGYAVYEMFWDPISDWFQNRLQAATQFAKLLGPLKGLFDATAAGAAIAEGACDVVWPVMVLDAREALRDACLLQLHQIVKDGRRKKIFRRDMKISVLCHSLGCFHTYEMLSAAARVAKHELSTPLTDLQIESVIMFASPVQMIRKAAQSIQAAVPQPQRLWCLKENQLSLPGFQKPNGQFIPYVRRFLSITGDLDPVGGHLARRKLGWAYMALPGTDRVIEEQHIAQFETEASFADVIRAALQGNQRWTVTPQNPHDWIAYVEHNAQRIREWLLS